jgi:hypothetical protein
MQAPSVMSALEVLQSCPTQWKELLKAIGGIDPTDANLIIFDLEDHIPRLPPQLAFQIQVVVTDKNICRTVIDEGASTCVMFVACWKSIGSPPLTESHNTLKAFNGSGFKPYGVLPSLPITLEAKSINVEVEVFYTPLDYNLLLGRSWIDSMLAVVSTLFYVVRFPHQDKVVAVDQLAFFNSDARTSNVPLISKTPLSYENVGVGLLKDSTLMGTFLIPRPNVPAPLVASINMISTCIRETPASFDPWIIPAPGYYLRYGGQKPLSPVESAYQAIQSEKPSTPSLGDSSPNLFHVFFPTDEMIMSVMSMEDTPWYDGHHCSSLFLEQHTLESYQRILTPLIVVVVSNVPESTHDVLYEGNLSNISPPSPLIYPLNLELSKMFTSELHVPPMRLSHINPFFRSFVTSSHRPMKRCWVLTPIFLYTKLRRTRALSPSSRDFAWSTLVKQLLSRLRLKNFLKLALFISWL